jgi:adenylyltransferase/sulfurtransferase
MEGGVLGVLPGVIGTLQATEAIKLLSGIGEPLTGRLLHYDALNAKFRSFSLRRDPECAVCGNNPNITDVTAVNYRLDSTEDTTSSISVAELSHKLETEENIILLDVREPEEVAVCSIEGATLIPLAQLKKRLGELPRNTTIFVHCKSGKRSARAVSLLRDEGYPDAINVRGGMDAWLKLENRNADAK